MTTIRWAPPDMSGSVTTLNIPTSGLSYSATATEKIKLNWPTSAMTGSVNISGGLYIVSYGGFANGATLGNNPNSQKAVVWPSNMGALDGPRPIIYFEGFKADLRSQSYQDIFTPGGKLVTAAQATAGRGPRPFLILQNCELHGANDDGAYHSDIVQKFAPMGGVKAFNVTGTFQWQGFFMTTQEGDSAGAWYAGGAEDSRYKNVNLHARTGRGGLGFWLNFDQNPGTSQLAPVPLPNTTLSNVWIDGAAGEPLSNLAWPTPSTGTQANGYPQNISMIVAGGGNSATWPAAARITGQLNRGTPPGGDFLPANTVGIGYTPATIDVIGAVNISGWGTDDPPRAKTNLGVNGDRVTLNYPNTALFESGIAADAAQGIKVHLTLDLTDYVTTTTANFAAWVKSIVQKYGPNGTSVAAIGNVPITDFSIMNEPWLIGEHPSGVSAATYANHCRAAADAIATITFGQAGFDPDIWITLNEMTGSQGSATFNSDMLVAQPDLFSRITGFDFHWYGDPANPSGFASTITTKLDPVKTWAWGQLGGGNKMFVITESNVTANNQVVAESVFSTQLPAAITAVVARPWIRQIYFYEYHADAATPYLGFVGSPTASPPNTDDTINVRSIAFKAAATQALTSVTPYQVTFEGGSLPAEATEVHNPANLSVVSTPSSAILAGTKSLRVTYPSGTWSTSGASGGALIAPYSGIPGIPTNFGQGEQHWRALVRFEPGFSWGTSGAQNGKIGGLAGQEVQAGNGYTGYVSARFVWEGVNPGTPNKIKLYCYHYGQPDTFGEYFPCLDSQGNQLVFTPGLTYALELAVKPNTPGSADGLLQAWVNDQLALNITNFQWRGPGESTIQFDSDHLVETFHGGGTSNYAPTVTSFAEFDNLTLGNVFLGSLLNNIANIAGTSSLSVTANENYSAKATIVGSSAVSAVTTNFNINSRYPDDLLYPTDGTFPSDGTQATESIPFIAGVGYLTRPGLFPTSPSQLARTTARPNGTGALLPGTYLLPSSAYKPTSSGAEASVVSGGIFISIAGSTTITASATVSNNLNISIDGHSDISVIGGFLASASAQIDGAGTVTTTGTGIKNGSSSIVGTSGISVDGQKVLLGSDTIVGTSTITVSGIRILTASAEIDGVSNIIASAPPSQSASAIINGTSSSLAAGTIIRLAAAQLDNIGTVTSAGLIIKLGQTTISGTSSLTSSGLRIMIGATTIVGATTITANGLRQTDGIVTISGISNIALTPGFVITGIGSIASGTSSLSASAMRIATASTLIDAHGDVLGSGSILYSADAVISGTSSAFINSGTDSPGSATIIGLSDLTVIGTLANLTEIDGTSSISVEGKIRRDKSSRVRYGKLGLRQRSGRMSAT